MSALKVNLIYQILYQVLNTCLPLITSPYLARTLGAEQQGVFSFLQSIVNFFVLFSMLGISNYGIREIAGCAGDYVKKNYVFWNIYAIQLFMAVLVNGLYCFYCMNLCIFHTYISCLLGIYVFACMFDISWFFWGIEKIKLTIKINFFIKVISVVSILLFVNSSDDLWIYTLIMGGSVFFNNILSWIYARKELNFRFMEYINLVSILRNVKPILLLFIPLLAMSVYHIMDKTMLGLLSNYKEVGFYYNVDKMVNIPIGVLTGVGTVMLPRASALISRNDINTFDNMLSISLEFIVILGIGMSFEIMAISPEFVPFFLGEEFRPCVGLLYILTPVLIIKGLSQIIRMQFLIPLHKEKVLIHSVLIGTVVNVFINLALIPSYGALGAVWGTLFAEAFAMIWQLYHIRKRINVVYLFISFIKYMFVGGFMYLAVRGVSDLFETLYLNLIVEISIGAIFYVFFIVIFLMRSYKRSVKSVLINLKSHF